VEEVGDNLKLHKKEVDKMEQVDYKGHLHKVFVDIVVVEHSTLV
jgi:hypothetical protein